MKPLAAEQTAANDHSPPKKTRSLTGPLFTAVLFLIASGLFAYALTLAFVWDEGFHLVAAQLIDAGKRPYIDFAFPQTVLNAYWNAALMRVFGQTWRVTHAGATLWAFGAVVLIADFARRGFPVRNWRLPAALAVACMVGLNLTVFQFGTVSQAYGFGLFFAVAAFRATVAAPSRNTVWIPLLAGFAAGAAGDSTLLTAPVIPVLLLWLFIYGHDRKTAKAIAFLMGVLIAFVPVFLLFAQGPKQTIFNVIEYQALFRRVNWGDTVTHDIEVLSDWLASLQAFMIGTLALIGGVFLYRRKPGEPEDRAEFYLAGWLALALGVYIATAHPTFGRYFVFMIPFAALIAAFGLYASAERLRYAHHMFAASAIVCLLMALTLGKALFQDRDSVTWQDYRKIADKIKEVTPPGKLFLADELVYFLLHVQPPPGMEFSYSHKLQLRPDQERLYHIISQAELKQQVQAGRFATVENCKDDIIEDFRLDDLFPNRADIADCSIYWGKVQPLSTAEKEKSK